MVGTVRDSRWVRHSFLAGTKDMESAHARLRTQSSADFKFTDTRLGGNFSINNPPQYTRHADLKVYSTSTNTRGYGAQGGMGRYYSEQIDDNSQIIHMRFGVPQFNGMFTFFTGFYDIEAGRLANTGRASGLFYNLGKLAGFAVSLPFWKYIALGHALRFFMQTPASKYYYLKPTMGQYWNRVNFILNDIAVNERIVPPVYSPDNEFSIDDDLANEQFTDEDRKRFHSSYPDIFKEGGGIDIYNVANRAERLAVKHREHLKKLQEEAVDFNDFLAKLQEYRNQFTTFEDHPRKFGDETGINAYLKRTHDVVDAEGYLYDPQNISLEDTEFLTQDAAVTDKSMRGSVTADEDLKSAENPDGLKFEQPGWWDRLWDHIVADAQDGSQFLSLKVDYTGSVNESFSNSTKDSAIAGKLNGMSSGAKDAKFSFSDGQTGFGIVDSIMNSAREVVSGIADGLQLSGLIGLAGSSFVDIPKQWDNSTANLPKLDYTIELRSPYGNPLSRFMNLHVPLACLLAAALPLSTGKQSYTSPFLCEVYDRGRNQVKLGMIDSLSITRGSGNLGWTRDGKPLGIDVQFSIVDMSSVLHAPVSGNFQLVPPWEGIFDDQNAFNDYLAAVSGLSLTDQIYSTRKLILNVTRKMENMSSYFSVARLSNNIMNDSPARIISAIALAGARGQ